MMKKALPFLMSILLCLLLGGQALAAGLLKVNTSIKPPFSTENETGFFDLLIKEIGKRINHEIELIRLPAERALASVNSGHSDGEMPRIAGMQRTYPHMVPVQEPLIDYYFVSFCKGNKYMVNTWEDMSEKHVGYLIGWKIYENNVPETAMVSALRNPSQLFNMLYMSRVDLALYERHAGREQIRVNEFDNLHECGEPLAVKPMYLYVNSRRSLLVPAIEKALRIMKRDGTYQEIFEKTLGKK